MNLTFNTKGNLPNDIILTLKEFESQFGYNAGRREKINNLVTVAKTLSSFGCKEMFITGSS